MDIQVSFTGYRTVKQEATAYVSISDAEIAARIMKSIEEDGINSQMVDMHGTIATLTAEVDMSDDIYNLVIHGDMHDVEVTDDDVMLSRTSYDPLSDWDDIDDIEVVS